MSKNLPRSGLVQQGDAAGRRFAPSLIGKTLEARFSNYSTYNYGIKYIPYMILNLILGKVLKTKRSMELTS